MTRQHHYELTTVWTGNTGNGTSDYRAYQRSHSILIEGKPELFCSSDPNFRGDKSKHNPEELFVAALSACHMLWFLHLCADAGIIVTKYSDNALGVMAETADGGGHFESVTLNPHVTVRESHMIEKTNALHHDAHKFCFVANSCNFPVLHQPICVAENS